MPYAPIYAVSQTDTLPPYTATLNVNLTTATSVTFVMANYFSGVVATGTATVVSASAGKVSYSWSQNDLATPGIYSIQWEVAFPSGTVIYPVNGYDYVTVLNNLAIGYPNVSSVFNTIHSSTSAPTSSQGNNGDYWYNTATTYFYGPKASGTWPAGFPLSASAVTLNNIAAPTGAVNMNGQKLTSLGNGSASTDGAAFGQIPLADTTAADINPLGVQGAGANGLWADSGHTHPFSSNILTTPVTVTGTTTATLLMAGPTVAIGAARANMIFEFAIWGVLTTTVDTQTVTLTARWGGASGTALISVGPSEPSSSATVSGVPWRFTGSVTLTSSTSATGEGQTDINYFPTAVNQQGATAITNTVAEQLAVTVTNSASTVSVTANGGWWKQTG